MYTIILLLACLISFVFCIQAIIKLINIIIPNILAGITILSFKEMEKKSKIGKLLVRITKVFDKKV
jgi:hypothetical protein